VDLLDPKIQEFIRRGGQQAKLIVSIYNKNRQFLNAMSSPTGQEIISELGGTFSSCVVEMQKIDVKKTNDEIAQEFKYIRAKMDLSDELISKYLRKLGEAEKALEKINSGKIGGK
jgi:uncharacterized protein YpiB (UPF0302 family)